MKSLLLSHNISENTPLYGGNQKVNINQEKAKGRGDSCNVLKLELNTHTSTHIDLPSHFIENGKTIDSYKPSDWIFRDIIIKELKFDIEDKRIIDENNFSNIRFNPTAELIIIKTGLEKERNSSGYIKNSPVVSASLAGFFKGKMPSLRAVGFDFISISSLQDREEGRRAHKEFLNKEILIIEDMKLSGLTDKPDYILVSPLFIENADGSPVSIWAFYKNFDINKYDYIFFDFDGVILDSVNIKTEAFKEIYREYGSSVMEKVARHHIEHGGMSRFKKFKLYHKEFLNKDLCDKEIEELAKEFSNIVFKKILKADFIPGAKEFLDACKNLNKTCFIVSGTPEDEMKRIIEKRKLKKYFKEVKGSPVSKEESVSSIINEYNIDRQRAVFFGDAFSDMNAANLNSLKFVGINIDSAMNYEDLKSMEYQQ